jgi:hypothetical protein
MKMRFAVLVFTFLLANFNSVYACSCGGYPTSCAAYAGAQAVFIGTVQQVQNQTTKNDEGQEYTFGQVAHVQVEKVFKGLKETEVVFRSWGSSCDAVYKEGQRWLFYAVYDEKNKSWGIGACGRSTLIDGAAEDLLYLQGLPASAKKTRISGMLEHYEDDPEKGFTRVNNVIGAKVKIIGAQQAYEVYTNKDGVFEIYGLPPGRYQIDPEIPLGLKLRFPIYFGGVDYSDRNIVKVVLEEKSCGSVNFLFSANTTIRGTLFGSDGLALPNVCLNLTPKDKKAASNWNFDCTNDQGRFELDKIPPGEYLIVVNSDGKISSNAPFPVAYYPGVFEKEKATVLAITDGTHLEDYDIHIPAQEASRVIQGVFLFSDGRPVADELVEFKAETVKEGYDGRAVTKTDAQGRFSLTLLQGLKGTLRGFMYTYLGEFVDCPKLDKLIKAKGNNAPDIGTKPMMLELNRDMTDVKLVFPFPACAKAKHD